MNKDKLPNWDPVLVIYLIPVPTIKSTVTKIIKSANIRDGAKISSLRIKHNKEKTMKQSAAVHH